jgi:hypothetical protein
MAMHERGSSIWKSVNTFGIVLNLTNKGKSFLSQRVDDLFEIFLNCRPEYGAKRDLGIVSAPVQVVRPNRYEKRRFGPVFSEHGVEKHFDIRIPG